MSEKINRDVWKGANFWMEEIKKAGVHDKLPHFNDVITGNNAPSGYGEPMVTDVLLDESLCDIYHTDHNGKTSGHRIYIHKKERING